MVYLLTRSTLLFICVTFVICTFSTAHFTKWPTKNQELLDEVHDVEIIKSVQKSMIEWEKTHKNHRRKRADKIVCYGDLGCFEDSGPFGYLDMLPSSPEEINTKFLFYSTKNRSDRPLVELPYLSMSEAWKVFSKNDTDPKEITNDISKKWKSLKNFEGLDNLSIRVIVHGFGSSCPHVWIYEMRTALMAVEDCIVICVDWENGANLPNYVRAAANSRLIGKQLAMFLKGLQEFKGLDLSRVHLIGFSLGAHASGFAGAELPGLNRITGLDPAGPLFESQHPKARLDSTDATFVDVIHSNGENLILGGLGSWQPMGHVDFYPNGGRVQHGCSNLFVGAVTDFIWSPAAAVEGRSLCNHRRAYKFFIDSVASRCLFPAFPCESHEDFLKGKCFPCNKAMENSQSGAQCGNMGYYADRSTGRGQLYLLTREEEPFCAHQFNIEIHNSEGDIPLRTLGKLEVIFEGDGSLNETFSITEKDDTELIDGQILSRILVPHPALGFPHSITLTYKSYSGWLSKGLPYWTIEKIVLTDSFGKKMSVCRKNINLESDKPIYLKLQTGECYLPNENDVTVGPDESSNLYESTVSTDLNRAHELKHSTSGPVNDDTDKFREKKEIIDLGTNFKITKNTTYSYSEKSDHLPWHPVLDGGNSLERETFDSKRNRHEITRPEIFEPVLKERGNEKDHKDVESSRATAREIHITSKDEIMEPILKSTTQKSRKMKTAPITNDISKSRESSFFTIQLLPFRLGELIERAERYARETLLPLISEQTPRFFGFGRGDEKSDRMPKYFPPLGEIAEETQASGISERRIDLPPLLSTPLVEVPEYEADISKIEGKITDNKSEDNETHFDKAAEARSIKNILGLLHPKGKELPEPSTERSYYRNIETKTDTERETVRIDLPTYKPSVTVSTTVFPYKFDSSLQDKIKVIPIHS